MELRWVTVDVRRVLDRKKASAATCRCVGVPPRKESRPPSAEMRKEPALMEGDWPSLRYTMEKMPSRASPPSEALSHPERLKVDASPQAADEWVSTSHAA